LKEQFRCVKIHPGVKNSHAAGFLRRCPYCFKANGTDEHKYAGFLDVSIISLIDTAVKK